MKRILILPAILSAGCLALEGQPITGSISGKLAGEDGSAITGAEIRLHLVPSAGSKVPQPQTDWIVTTVTGGAFQASELPEGTYTLCPRAPNTTWLSPCEWNLPTPIGTISRSNPNATVPITLKRGVSVPVRVDDPAQLMATNEGKTPGAGLFLCVRGPGLFFRRVPLVSTDSGGRNYQIVVPFDTGLTLMVHPSFYRLAAANNVALSQSASTQIPLLFSAGQQASPIKFTISGAGH